MDNCDLELLRRWVPDYDAVGPTRLRIKVIAEGVEYEFELHGVLSVELVESHRPIGRVQVAGTLLRQEAKVRQEGPPE